MTTDNTTPNLTIVIPAYINLALPKPKSNLSKSLNDDNKVTWVARLWGELIVIRDNIDSEYVLFVTSVRKLFTITFQFS